MFAHDILVSFPVSVNPGKYFVNKLFLDINRLPPDMIEGMRESYRKSLRFLQTLRIQGSEEDMQAEFRRTVLVAVGFKQEAMEKLDFENLGDADFESKVKERLLDGLVNNGAKQKIVPVGEVENHIRDGWEFVASLGEKVILKLPA